VEEVPWSKVYQNWQTQERTEMRQSTAPFFVADLHFVYAFGAQLVHAAWTQGGWPAVEGLVGAPPASSRQVLGGFAAPEPAGGPWTESLDAEALPVLPGPFQLVAHDELGAWLLETYLHRQRVAEDRALASHLRGDHLSIHDEPSTGATVTVWRLRFDSVEAAAATLTDLAPRVPLSVQVWLRDRDLVLAVSNRGSLPFGPDLMFRPVPPPLTPAPGMSPGRIGCPARTIAR
jgi:hypothetical protein